MRHYKSIGLHDTNIFFTEVDKADEFFRGLLDLGWSSSVELLGYEYEY